MSNRKNRKWTGMALMAIWYTYSSKSFERFIKKCRIQVTTVLGRLAEYYMLSIRVKNYWSTHSSRISIRSSSLWRATFTQTTYSLWLRRQGYDNVAKHIFKKLALTKTKVSSCIFIAWHSSWPLQNGSLFSLFLQSIYENSIANICHDF